VVVIGGGDTGSDCIGTANRQGAASVAQLEIMPQPPLHENKALTWPHWPLKLRTSSSQEEGCERDFSVVTTAFQGDSSVESLRCARVRWDGGRLEQVADSGFEIRADLVLLAMGFTGTPPEGVAGRAGVALSANGAVRTEAGRYQTSRERVFACGDMRRGQSLVVWAIREGRECADAVHFALTGETRLAR